MSNFNTRYVPTAIEDIISGKNPKRGKLYRRPFFMDVRTFYITTKDGTRVCPTYLLFGGIPQKKVHDALRKNGFVCRKVNETYKNKKGGTMSVFDNDRSCWSVYYSENKEAAAVQIAVWHFSDGLIAENVDNEENLKHLTLRLSFY